MSDSIRRRSFLALGAGAAVAATIPANLYASVSVIRASGEGNTSVDAGAGAVIDLKNETDPYRRAVIDGNLAVVQQHLEKDPALLYARDAQGQSVYLLAAYAGQPAVMALFESKGLVLDIYEAAAGGKTDRVNELLRPAPGLVKAPNAAGIGMNQPDSAVYRRFQADLLGLGGSLHHVDGLLDYVVHDHATRIDAYLSSFRASRLQKMANHGVQLICAAHDGVQMFALFSGNWASQAIQQNGNELMDGAERRAQFVGDVREKDIPLPYLVFSHKIGFRLHALTLHRMAESLRQGSVFDLAFNQIILRALLHSFGCECFVLQACQHNHHHGGGRCAGSA